MELSEAEVVKRRIPCDKPIKLALLFALCVGVAVTFHRFSPSADW